MEEKTTFKVVKFHDNVIGTLMPKDIKTVNGKISGRYGEKYYPITVVGNSGFFLFSISSFLFALSNSFSCPSDVEIPLVWPKSEKVDFFFFENFFFFFRFRRR